MATIVGRMGKEPFEKKRGVRKEISLREEPAPKMFRK